jgi:hypothetical protein
MSPSTKEVFPAPAAIIISGRRANDVSTVTRGFFGFDEMPPSLFLSALTIAISLSNIEVVRYLIEQQHASVADIVASTVDTNASIELLQLLVDHGFDINKSTQTPSLRQGPYLLQQVCKDETLVRWCIEHGAKLEGMLEDPYYSQALLQSVAAFGTVSTLKYLLSRGAKLEGRILHCAAERAGARSNEGPEMYQSRLAMRSI